MDPDTEFAHLAREIRPLARLGPEERIVSIRTERWIPHRAAVRILGYMQEIADQPLRDRMENLLILGESGMGKTKLAHAFEKQNVPCFDETRGVEKRQVVSMLMPPQPTGPEFVANLLAAIGVPVGRSDPAVSPHKTAIRVLREIGARVLVIDEISSVLMGSPAMQQKFLQFLQFLSSNVKLAIIGVGLPEARQALLSDAQFCSRFSNIELSPWTPDEDLRDFVARFIWSLPLRRPSPVDSATLRNLLVERSGGITLNVIKAFERAAIAAIHSGSESIELASFGNPEIWHGIAAPSHLRRLRPPMRPRRGAA